MNDYPAMIAAANHVEPVPRRIRAFLAGEKVFDTTRARYVWEWPNYPQYYIPLEDVRRDLMIPEGHSQHSRRGTKYSCRSWTAMARSPMAEATRLTDRSVWRSGWPARH